MTKLKHSFHCTLVPLPTFLLVQQRWCDQELGKFASTFGGPRLLGRLSLTSATDSATATSGEGPTGSTNTGTTSKQPFSSLDKNPKVAENYRQVRTKTALPSFYPLCTSCCTHYTLLALPLFFLRQRWLLPQKLSTMFLPRRQII